jgi:hypothetical protein
MVDWNGAKMRQKVKLSKSGTTKGIRSTGPGSTWISGMGLTLTSLRSSRPGYTVRLTREQISYGSASSTLGLPLYKMTTMIAMNIFDLNPKSTTQVI